MIGNEASDTAEECLKHCYDKIKKNDFDNAVVLFKLSLTAEGDQACFFFEDIVRLLIQQNKLNLRIGELYRDYGITDKAKKALQNLTDQDIKLAFEIYAQKHNFNVTEQ